MVTKINYKNRYPWQSIHQTQYTKLRVNEHKHQQTFWTMIKQIISRYEKLSWSDQNDFIFDNRCVSNKNIADSFSTYFTNVGWELGVNVNI